ncbi:MAG: ACP phosphodiesterase [Planctomycetes bacterium]|nr:ACP phosphodiesterase [Planctomycetota bacterium]
MNFLAHLYLADNSPEAMIGSLIPDLVKPRQLPADLPPATLDAIAQHRRVDAFTDMHPVVARSKRRLFEHHGRYTGILVDVFYDHFLAADWAHYHDEPLTTFVSRVHAGFRSHSHLLPTDMRYPIDRLVEQDWLGSYATAEGIRVALERLSLRLSKRFERHVDLAAAVPDMIEHRDGLADDFRVFFPDLIAYSAPHRIVRAAVA